MCALRIHTIDRGWIREKEQKGKGKKEGEKGRGNDEWREEKRWRVSVNIRNQTGKKFLFISHISHVDDMIFLYIRSLITRILRKLFLYK